MNLRSPAATKVIGSLALVVLAAAAWTFVVSPRTSALAEVQTQIADTRDQNDILTLQLAALDKQREGLPQTRATAAALERKFPATADQPGLFRQVTAAAAAAGIPGRRVTALTPTAPVVGGATQTDGVALPDQQAAGDLARQTVTITVEGDYAETQDLLVHLEEMERAYLISSLTLSTGTQPGSFLTTITGEMFVMPPASRAVEREDSVPAPGQDTGPAASASDVP